MDDWESWMEALAEEASVTQSQSHAAKTELKREWTPASN